MTRPGNQLLWSSTGGEVPHLASSLEWALLALGAAIALFCAHSGFHGFRSGPAPDDALRTQKPELSRFLEGAWQIDRTYDLRVVQPLRAGARRLAAFIDLGGIDAAVNGTGNIARAVGTRLIGLADGHVKHYALWMGAGAALLSASLGGPLMLALLCFLPLLGAVAVAMVPAGREALARLVALGATLVVAALGLALYLGFDGAAPGFQSEWVRPWFRAGRPPRGPSPYSCTSASTGSPSSWSP